MNRPSQTFGLGVLIFSAVFVVPLPWGMGFVSGDNVANATTMKQCMDRYFACNNRCRDNANDKYGKDTKRATIEMTNCDNRTCMPQVRNCTANASDKPKPNSLDPGAPTSGPGTKVVPGGVNQGAGPITGK